MPLTVVVVTDSDRPGSRRIETCDPVWPPARRRRRHRRGRGRAARRLADRWTADRRLRARAAARKPAPRTPSPSPTGPPRCTPRSSVAGIGPGDRVLTSPLSFVASANCARYVGAARRLRRHRPEDVEPRPGRGRRVRRAGRGALRGAAGRPRARLPTRPRVVVEDAAHALGASTPDGPVGNCARSDMCTFSFHPVKAITTGEGGAVTTNSRRLADAAAPRSGIARHGAPARARRLVLRRRDRSATTTGSPTCRPRWA